MNSSRMVKPQPGSREPLLVGEAGVPYRAVPADPIAAWLDLMETVEALASRQVAPGHVVGKDYRL